MGRPGDDPIFALHGEATQRAQAGESIVNATLGALITDEGALAFMPVAAETMASVSPARAAAYAPIAGDMAYLEAVIADLLPEELRRFAVATATPGGSGALHHAFVNFLEAGQAALTTQFFWGPYRAMATHALRRLDTFGMFDEAGQFNVRAFSEALNMQVREQGRVLALLNFPCHNPTGFSLTEDDWGAVAEVVEEAGRRAPVTLLIDHAYARFGPVSGQGWVQHVPRMLESATVLVAWTASKTFTQYGARVGALVALSADAGERMEISNALNYSCRATWSNCNHRGLLAVTDLLTDPELRVRAEAERQVLIDMLDGRIRRFNEEARRLELPYPRYDGGFFVSVFTPDPEATAARMRELGVYVVPINGAVRVGLCATATADVPRVVEALAAGVV